MTGLPSTACSLSTAAVDEPAYGSAAPAQAWVALEQAGPWGHDAVVDSHLDPALGRSLRVRVEAAGGRLALVRDPGRHPDKRPSSQPRVAISSARPGNSWLLTGRLAGPDRLQDMDFDALSTGDLKGVRSSLPELSASQRPLLLVCTNGRRDVCCAVFGRPLAHDARIQRPGQVWETSHTGGHRFSPTAVVLPWGLTIARLDLRLALSMLDEAATGHLPRELLGPEHDRGRSALTPPAQAAESAVRAAVRETGIESLRTTVSDNGSGHWSAVVRHLDGRHWRADVRREPGAGVRAPSCAKRPEPYSVYAVTVSGQEARDD